ncbi:MULTISPECIES: carbohydrate ABC transporter permease [Lacrimispora]|jgi:multiple sugar transport system permease protein|uniref:Multiple sugar transport system permease protein n=1 Tax=Lacrimispora sphenoides JCM 1415 TaxID=1297793 RepID=A0ABY1CJ64_9FIRM|nr:MULTISPECIES: carbohydrate ABC transporter permease [Lacrimispora]EXG85082.1 carbohydrate ABC transporter membrane protein 2, CUT1 family [Clostridium sp. ASBs410]MDR7814440.1 carbohydrate ABC transporter permease [Lacrimispora sp.]SEU08396.1 multiple sugar transport system permease protein [[Clostridium] sphenoides JCM 1415]SUY49344.1 binding-protein-dependent transport system inner membrane protein [Lacrimispora sphenoides]
MKTKRKIGKIFYHVIVCGLGLVMIYPLVWMVMSSFKETSTIFQTAGQLIPEKFVFSNYINGWKGFAKITFATFFKNSLFIAVAATFGTVFSSALVAYGLARCRFFGRRALFVAMLLSMMLPAQVLMIPQYLWYQKLGWVGSYKPLILPYCFAIQGFFVYMMINFIDGIPRELDEAAKIDGCSYYGIFSRIIMPLISPALITASIFSFMWRWDDFLSALLYINESAKYPVSLALKLFCDPGSSSDYGAMFAMATLSILPAVIIFICLQKYLVEGISTSGLKG